MFRFLCNRNIIKRSAYFYVVVPYSFIDLYFSDWLLLILCYFLLSFTFISSFFLSFLPSFPTSFLHVFLPSSLPSWFQDFERERGQSANSKVAQFVGKPSQSWTSSSLRSSPTGRSTWSPLNYFVSSHPLWCDGISLTSYVDATHLLHLYSHTQHSTLPSFLLYCVFSLSPL